MKINTLSITNNILKKYNLKAKKSYGQNFLVSDDILEKIMKAADIKANELVIEVGPGLGNLTEYILKFATYACLVEIDKDMIEILNDRFGTSFSKYEILNEDILKVDINEKISEIESKLNTKFSQVKVIANLPYYITSPILFKLLQESNRISEIVVMVQKEVADRIVAKPKTKDNSILTIMTNYYSATSVVTNVSREFFLPAPNVDSAVVKLVKNKTYDNVNENIFSELVHKAFALRRKKMINSLVSNNFMNIEKTKLEEVFLKLNLSLNTRAEELGLEDYILITNEIDMLVKK